MPWMGPSGRETVAAGERPGLYRGAERVRLNCRQSGALDRQRPAARERNGACRVGVSANLGWPVGHIDRRWTGIHHLPAWMLIWHRDAARLELGAWSWEHGIITMLGARGTPSNAPWITVTSGVSGSGAEVGFASGTNVGPQRTGTLAVLATPSSDADLGLFGCRIDQRSAVDGNFRVGIVIVTMSARTVPERPRRHRYRGSRAQG
jgi:hypothetical protein